MRTKYWRLIVRVGIALFMMSGCSNTTNIQNNVEISEQSPDRSGDSRMLRQDQAEITEEHDQNSGSEVMSFTETNNDQQEAHTSIQNISTEEPVHLHEVTDDRVFVNVSDYIPDAVVDLKYASSDNFTGQLIYSFHEAFLRYGTVKKLCRVQEKLAENGYRLRIWDAFRPVSAQYTLWEAYPDPVFVANPNHGYSSHSRGNTVDVTMVFMDGSEVEMPSGFDDFTGKADRNYSDCSMDAGEHAGFLEQVMIECGFIPYEGEWWHYSDTDTYEVESEFEP